MANNTKACSSKTTIINCLFRRYPLIIADIFISTTICYYQYKTTPSETAAIPHPKQLSLNIQWNKRSFNADKTKVAAYSKAA